MLFSWLKQQRRKRILSEPFPDQWFDYLQRNVRFYSHVTEADQKKLRDDLRVFIALKHWEGCGGLELTDEIRVTIAAQACLLSLHLDDEAFDRVVTVLVYPHGYRAVGRQVNRSGLVHEGPEGRLGEAWYRGPVILSWTDALAGAKQSNDGQNVVFHEFAHQLDMLTGAADGMPPQPSLEQAIRWQEVFTREHQRLVRQSNRGQRTLLDPYGATNPAEFFAVTTECFFELPDALHHYHPNLYRLMSDYFAQDPRCWTA